MSSSPISLCDSAGSYPLTEEGHSCPPRPVWVFTRCKRIRSPGLVKKQEEPSPLQPLQKERKTQPKWRFVNSCVVSLVWKGTGMQKVASLRLRIASHCACREGSLPLSFLCKTRHECRITFFLNAEVRTQAHQQLTHVSRSLSIRQCKCPQLMTNIGQKLKEKGLSQQFYPTNDKKCFSAAEEPCTVQLPSIALQNEEIGWDARSVPRASGSAGKLPHTQAKGGSLSKNILM